MTSERKAAANRRNGRKGRGPRSAAGKSLASRNALRHGLAALNHHQPAAKEDIERLAKALCGDDPNPSLLEQARIIAKNELVLRAIGAQQLAVVERVREPTAIAFAKGRNDLRLADQRFRKAKLADEALIALRDRLLEQYKDELPAAIVRDSEEQAFGPVVVVSYLLSFLQDKKDAEGLPQSDNGELAAKPIVERDEGAALEEAAADLVRLDRYERRAWSRQKRAIRAFLNIKTLQRLGTPAVASERDATSDRDLATKDFVNKNGSFRSARLEY